MDIDTAFNNIQQVIRAYRGTADEHDLLRSSLEAIVLLINEHKSRQSESTTEVNATNPENS